MSVQKNNLLLISNDGETDPAYNLALEEYAVRQFPPENDYLFLYVNNSSVILGKHQNIAEEVNQPFCYEKKIPVFRRISGGGTVYHDAGNLNFSFITAHTIKNFNNYFNFIKPILEILQRFDKDVNLDQANNLVFQGKKLSGNAQFTSRGRMVSHGTLLFNADLKQLRESLKIDPNMHIESRSTKSRRSSVANLNAFRPFAHLSIARFRQLLLEQIFKGSITEYVLTEEDKVNIHALAHSKYRDWEWNYGRSPACTIYKPGLVLEIEAGRIIKIEYPKAASVGFDSQALVDQKYDYGIIKDGLHSGSLMQFISNKKERIILSSLF